MKDFKKDSKKESSSSPKGEEKAPPKKADPKKADPKAPMRRKNRVFGDGKDWFDTHPDA